MSEPGIFDRHEMQRVMLSAGVVPRDLAKIMPCHHATLYAYFKTGVARPLTLFSFERIYGFLRQAFNEGVLPFNGPVRDRPAFIKKEFDNWHFNSGNFGGGNKQE